MAHTFDEQLSHLLGVAENLELERFTVNLFPVYAERDKNIRPSRRESLERVCTLVDARLETLQRITSKIQLLERDLQYRRGCVLNARAPVDSLSPEVLGAIFGSAVATSPPQWTRRLAINITHVCSFWRAVAIRQPLMWRRVVLCDGNRSWHRRWSVNGLAEEWIRRASNSPLDVLVEQRFFRTLKRLEIPNWKIRSLSLVDVNMESDHHYSTESDWDYIRNLSLPSLETLRITTLHSASSMITFNTNTNLFPSLRELIITGDWEPLLRDMVPLYGSQLRSLFLGGGTLGSKACRTISCFCPSLEVLFLDDNVAESSDWTNEDEILWDEVWMFSTIIHLEILNISPGLSDALARQARFPNLRSYVMTLIPTKGENRRAAYPNLLLRVVEQARFLEDLEIRGPQREVSTLLERFLEATVPKSPHNLDSSSLSLPPSLHALRLSWDPYMESPDTNLGSIIDKLRSRLWDEARCADDVDKATLSLITPRSSQVPSSTTKECEPTFEHLETPRGEAYYHNWFEQIGTRSLRFFDRRPPRLRSNLFSYE